MTTATAAADSGRRGISFGQFLNLMGARLEIWRLSLKAVAYNREGSKHIQSLSSAENQQQSTVPEKSTPRPSRRKLPEERRSITHKFSIGGHEGYITVGMYEDGTAGEIFITMAKEGSTISGLMDSMAVVTSLSLQYGVPLRFLVDKFSHVRFEPSGWTGNSQIPYAKSIMDYIFRWLQLRFLTGQQQALFDGLRPKYMGGVAPVSAPDDPNYVAPSSSVIPGEGAAVPESRDPFGAHEPSLFSGSRVGAPGGMGTSHHHAADALKELIDMGDAPSCSVCGAIMTRNGSCYRCMSCGSTSGCS